MWIGICEQQQRNRTVAESRWRQTKSIHMGTCLLLCVLDRPTALLMCSCHCHAPRTSDHDQASLWYYSFLRHTKQAGPGTR